MGDGDHFGETQDGPEREAQRREWRREREEREERDRVETRLRARVAELEAEVERLRADRDEIIGNGEAMNDGPTSHCSDCGRRMVWERKPAQPTGDTYPSPGSWMCPRCVMERCRRAEAKVERLTKERDEP